MNLPDAGSVQAGERTVASGAPAAVAAGLIGLAASVALYLGMVNAVPLVDWGDDATELLQSEGARAVRIASLFAGLAGVLLLVGRARVAGCTAVVAALLLAVLADTNTIASWGLLLLYLTALVAGCRTVARRRPPLTP